MKVGIILLSQDNFYVDSTGALPKRPAFDKELLVALCQGQRAVIGPNTRKTLPKSIAENITEVTWDSEYDINLGIVPFRVQPPHLLIVVRSSEWLHTGKSFDLLPYNLGYNSEDLELYILRKSI